MCTSKVLNKERKQGVYHIWWKLDKDARTVVQDCFLTVHQNQGDLFDHQVCSIATYFNNAGYNTEKVTSHML